MLISFLPNNKTRKKINDNNLSVTDPVFFFRMAREAMRSALDLLDFEKDQVVLMPASLCPAVIDPFSNYGLKIRLYTLDRYLQWNIDSLRDQITPNTVAIYVIHYFGITYDLTEIRELCDECGLILIEDCALAGYEPSAVIGSFGDVAIFSLWKFHPIASGAVLRINNKTLPVNMLSLQYPPWRSSLGGQLKIKVKSILEKFSISLNFLKRALKLTSQVQDPPPDDIFNQAYPVFAMSSWIKNIFVSEDLKKCANVRRSNYNALHNALTEAGIKTLFPGIISDSVPYCLPILVDDPVDLQKKLAVVGIETEISVNKAFYNQNYLIDIDGRFVDVDYLAEHALSIPVHQNLDFSHLLYIKKWLIKYVF